MKLFTAVTPVNAVGSAQQNRTARRQPACSQDETSDQGRLAA